MRFAIFSDLHDNMDGFHQVLMDIEQQRADHLIFLGDAGRTAQIFVGLQQRRVTCLFGNWEVSGLRRLPGPLARWVGAWSATRQQGQAIFCHATPDMPATALTTAAAVQHMAGGVGWATLFPRLNRNEQARWVALAALESADLRVAFHGHTHVQEVWLWQADQDGKRHLHTLTAPTEFSLEPGPASAPTRYLVGIGSAGQPDDGPQLCYALYDDKTNRVLLRKL